MAMINCPKCKKEVSDEANKCPNCGLKLNKPKSGVFEIIYRRLLTLFNISMITAFMLGLIIIINNNKHTSLNSDSSCYPTKDDKITCDVTVESITGKIQFLEFNVPKGIKEVEVGVQITVEKGAVTAWVEDSMQKKVQVTVKKDQLSAFKGLAEVKKSFYNFQNEAVFRLYLDSHFDVLFKKAEDIKIKIIYGLPTKQNSNLSKIQQLKQVISEKIALNPIKLGVIKLIANQQNQYIATQIFHPFNGLKQKQSNFS